MESVCRGNSTVGSNPTLSAIYKAVPSSSPIHVCATECYIFCGNCTPLHELAGGKLNVAITTVYFRRKTNRGWRYSALGIGRCPPAAKSGPFFIRVRDAANKYKWQKHETESDAKKAAERDPVARKSQESGLTVEDRTNAANTYRISIKTAVENYLQNRRIGRPRSIAAYENAFDQLLENPPRGVRFINQLATSRALNSYVEFLREQDYSNKTTAIMAAEGSFGRQKNAAHWVGKLEPSRRNPSATMSLRSASPECVPGPLIIPPSSQRPFREAIVVSWLWRAPPV